MNAKYPLELPPKYYLDHFNELIGLLRSYYKSYFAPEHESFLADFESMTEDARCLLVRLINRKGEYFYKSALKYEEIADIALAWSELQKNSFIRDVVEADHEKVISFLAKGKLCELLKKSGIPFNKSSSKEELQALAKENLDELKFEETSLLGDIIVQSRTEDLSYLLYLYFGKIQTNLTLYTLRDLGIRKTNDFKGNFKARFVSQEDAQSQYFYASLKNRLSASTPIDEIANWPTPLNAETMQAREDLLVYLGEALKRDEDYDLALQVLTYCNAHPGREKRVRLLYQLDMKEKCLEELNLILDNPCSDEEYLFADDFLARKFHKKKVSQLTEILRDARKVQVDEAFYRHPELGVRNYFLKSGIESYFTENHLWNSLFGLLFWHELFESENSAIHNQFDRTPHDLAGRDFYSNHQSHIEEKLSFLSDSQTFSSYLNKLLLEKTGVLNGVFNWHPDLLNLITKLWQHSSPESIRSILLYMAQDYKNRSTGFPDLMAIEEGKAVFYEIKAQGDSLRPNQLKQLTQLKNAGFHVEVLRVEYNVNPDQTYVVVDLETTGGSPHHHRITEVGAVKIKDGRIIDTFQTLVNPQRPIPANIQALTGITNSMVANAPVFSEISDQFLEFTKDSIFVAHNVQFDYGFIQSEFNRLEKRFVRPNICTKVGMRKHYPGLASYGLKNLTYHFAIPLQNHHRAMDDAKAAAHLLMLINEKRRSNLELSASNEHQSDAQT